ncbi:MAG: flagellar FliJ family protein [Actinomycetaceae bacterium]|nr:flagellar FliJ family protein [Actinomycetaceae bacterium]
MNRAFRLQGLLNLRQLQEDQAAGRLAEANADLTQRERQLQRSKERLASCAIEDGTDGQSLATHVAMRVSAQLAIEVNEQRRIEAARVVYARQADWSGARRKTATLEKLEDRHIQAVVADELNKEQAVLDEIATQRGAASLRAAGSEGQGGKA